MTKDERAELCSMISRAMMDCDKTCADMKRGSEDTMTIVKRMNDAMDVLERVSEKIRTMPTIEWEDTPHITSDSPIVLKDCVTHEPYLHFGNRKLRIADLTALETDAFKPTMNVYRLNAVKNECNAYALIVASDETQAKAVFESDGECLDNYDEVFVRPIHGIAPMDGKAKLLHALFYTL